MAGKPLYKVVFSNRDQVFEIYAREVSQGGMFGFVEIAELVFGEKTTVLVDPAEEKLKNEFAGVKRFFVPMHAVIRIDEVTERGTARIVDGDGSNVTPFPVYTPSAPSSPGGA